MVEADPSHSRKPECNCCLMRGRRGTPRRKRSRRCCTNMGSSQRLCDGRTRYEPGDGDVPVVKSDRFSGVDH